MSFLRCTNWNLPAEGNWRDLWLKHFQFGRKGNPLATFSYLSCAGDRPAAPATSWGHKSRFCQRRPRQKTRKSECVWLNSSQCPTACDFSHTSSLRGAAVVFSTSLARERAFWDTGQARRTAWARNLHSAANQSLFRPRQIKSGKYWIYNMLSILGLLLWAMSGLLNGASRQWPLGHKGPTG